MCFLSHVYMFIISYDSLWLWTIIEFFIIFIDDCDVQSEGHEISSKKNCGETLVGVFSLVDACRSGALEAIEELKLLGVRSVMLTGDSSQVAMYVQSQVWSL
jgi:magnesium-transporting ATPase (P-type)